MNVAVIYFAFLALLTVSVLLRPSRVLAGIIVLFSLKQWSMAKSLWFLNHRVITNYAVAGLVGIALVITIFKHRMNLGRYTAAGWAALGLHALAFVSYLWCVNQGWWVVQWIEWAPYVILIVLLLPLVIVTPRDLYDALIATLLFGVPVLLLLLFTVQFHGREIVYVGALWVNGQRATGGNPLATSEMAGHILLIGVLMRFTGLARFWQILRWVIVALALALIMQSGSRGQLFATVACVVLLLPFSRHIRNLRGFAAMALGLGIFAILCVWAYDTFAQASRWDMGLAVKDVEVGRIATSMHVLRYWLSHPTSILFGLGNSSSFDPRVNSWFCEVQPVDILGEEGLVGIGLWLIIVVACWRAFRRMRKDPRIAGDVRLRGIGATIFAMFLFEFILSWKEGSLLADPNVFAFATIVCRYEWALRWLPDPAAPVEEWRVSHELNGLASEPDVEYGYEPAIAYEA